ncbi:Transmembrane adaptor Erv26-like protein [Sarcoptes scabiei]|uniref:Protein TEX261 n=1 Tax=Sarcoptes scabiei TaxID=52283 RepID=A0A131ZWG7_SARSC|nr:Transmembrane adaptor Erv26-like protein [Sarcoptes scabiei]
MWFFMLLGWFGVLVLLVFFILSLATGLYYLAELIEEYTTISYKIIKKINFNLVCLYDNLTLWSLPVHLPNYLIICGLISHLNHILILRTFPFFQFSSPPFILFIAFTYFAKVNVYFIQVLSYFTICLWIIPFVCSIKIKFEFVRLITLSPLKAFFVSLSVNDYVLPTSIENRDENDLISHYFSRKDKRSGLLSLFSYAKESILPQQIEKPHLR